MNEYRSKDDQTLVSLTLLGEENAYAELVSRYERAVMGTVCKVTENRYTAEDASQDAFVSAWMNLSALRDTSKFGSWVCAIAKNHARTLEAHYRSTVPSLSLDTMEGYEAADIPGEDYSDLHDAIDALSEKIRETVRLHYFENLSVKEIAAKLSISEGTVKWRLSEGRNQLRKGFGIMEKAYNENEDMVSRVMRQVEALKMWKLKEDKTGFKAEYEIVLNAVNDLPDSKEKSHALADTLILAYWWLEGENNAEMLSRIKTEAEKGHNDDVMQSVAANEYEKYEGDEKIAFMRDIQIPEYKEKGFVGTAAYLTFWLGYEHRQKGQTETAIEYYKQVLEMLPPHAVYYANAVAAIKGEQTVIDASKTGINKDEVGCDVTGEELKYIDGKLIFWSQPGYGCGPETDNLAIFYNCNTVDSIIYDESITDGSFSNTYGTVTVKSGMACETPSGKFEDCSVYTFNGQYYGIGYTETYFKYGVGIVKQTVDRYGHKAVIELSKYTVNGGEGVVPFKVGNRWEYKAETSHKFTEFVREISYEITGCKDNSAAFASVCTVYSPGYSDTWEGNIVKARQKYHDTNNVLVDMRPVLTRAKELAQTRLQKLHSQIAENVMLRIYGGDPVFNPDYIEKGRWNFFSYHSVASHDGKVTLDDDRYYSFEWKEMGNVSAEGWKLLYSFFDNIISDAMECMWSDEWVDGYELKKRTGRFGTVKNFKVKDGETVTVKSGTFTNCKHISFEFERKYIGYFCGKSEYWYAEGVGIVKFEHPFWDNQLAVWELSEYTGTGKGYFPTDDGLYRKFEPLPLGEGWKGAVEYTFVKENGAHVLLRNALGTQKREDYEKTLNK